MLWPILVKKGLPLELAKYVDTFASMVQVVSCAVPDCHGVAVSAGRLCRQHSHSTVKFFFLFPCKAPFVCEGSDSALTVLETRFYYATVKIQGMNNGVVATEAKKDKIVERDNIAEAIKLVEAWERSPWHIFFKEGNHQTIIFFKLGNLLNWAIY
jgi:hypothetical protein